MYIYIHNPNVFRFYILLSPCIYVYLELINSCELFAETWWLEFSFFGFCLLVFLFFFINISSLNFWFSLNFIHEHLRIYVGFVLQSSSLLANIKQSFFSVGIIRWIVWTCRISFSLFSFLYNIYSHTESERVREKEIRGDVYLLWLETQFVWIHFSCSCC